jgi:hypothetical protein
MYLNFYKKSLTKMMWSLFIGIPNIFYYYCFYHFSPYNYPSLIISMVPTVYGHMRK